MFLIYEKLTNVKKVPKAPSRFELEISCLLDRRFNQLSHGAWWQNIFWQKNKFFYCVLKEWLDKV